MEEGGAPMPTSGMPEQTSPISIWENYFYSYYFASLTNLKVMPI
jgi:hypothetical protein